MAQAIPFIAIISVLISLQVTPAIYNILFGGE
jgi:hypothetical protein